MNNVEWLMNQGGRTTKNYGLGWVRAWRSTSQGLTGF